MTSSGDEFHEREISADDVNQKLESGDSITLVDIRERRERDHVKLQDDEWVPMGEVPEHLDRFREASKPLVLYCHHGQRSLRTALYLGKEGIEDVYSLAGGIDYWAHEIDPELPTY